MLALLILAPLLALIVLNLPALRLMPSASRVLVMLLAIAQMVIALAKPFGLFDPRTIRTIFTYDLSADGLSMLMLLAIGLVVLIAAIVAGSTLKDPRQQYNFLNVMLIALIGMNGTVLVRDLFTLYVFLEITAVSSFILIAIQRGRAALEGALKYVILSAVASVLMLGAIGLLMIVCGSTGFGAVKTALSDDDSASLLSKIAIGGFLCGLFIKGGLVPFHGWLPGAYSTAPAAASVLLAGIVTKISGIYALVRLVTTVFVFNSNVNQVLLAVGALSIVVGALAALSQKDMKKMLAWSSISQVGYILLGLGCGSDWGVIGAVFHLFNHAVFKSLLFVNSAALEERVGTTDMSQMGGLGGPMPVTGLTSVLACLSTAGVPPLAGFWSKLIILVALWTAGQYVYAGVAVAASVLTLAYLLIVQRRIFFGLLPDSLRETREASPGLVFSEILLGVLTLGIGVAVPFVLEPMAHSIGKLIGG